METNTIAKRLLSGSILRTMLLLCNVAVSFFMMPFLIHSLGDRWYGFWIFVGTFVGYYGVLDLGLNSAVSRYVSRAYGQNDKNEMNIVINTSLVLFCIVGLFVMIISVAVALMSSYFIQVPEDVSIFRILILILGTDIAISFPMRAFAGVLTSKLRYDLSTYIELTKLAIRTLLVFYFIKSGHGLIALAIITICVNLLSYGANFILVKREFPELRFGASYVLRERIKSLFAYSKYTFLAQLADILRFKIDSFVIAGFLGLNLVTIYYIAARLVEFFGQLIISSIGILAPVYSQYDGRGDYAQIRKIFMKATRLSSAMVFFVGANIIFYGKDFIYLWMGAEYKDSYYVLVILCISAMTGLMQNPSIGLLYGISKHKFYAISNICEGALNVLLSIILVQYYGIFGVAMGTLIEMIIFKIIVQPIYTCRVIEVSLYEYYKIFCLTFVKIVPFMLLYFYFTQFFSLDTYTSIAISVIGNGIVMFTFIWFLVLEKDVKLSIQHVFVKN